MGVTPDRYGRNGRTDIWYFATYPEPSRTWSGERLSTEVVDMEMCQSITRGLKPQHGPSMIGVDPIEKLRGAPILHVQMLDGLKGSPCPEMV